MLMRKLAVVLLIVIASTTYGDQKGQAQAVAGSYSGPSESYGLVLELAPDGTLRGNYVEMGRVAVLNAIELRGSEFTARASFDDGSLRTISGSFGRRKKAFGLRMHNVPMDGVGRVEAFFERL
ncbi:MAG: hypothetical protein ACXW28_06390 [Thermoanaerobaculia bacterium]